MNSKSNKVFTLLYPSLEERWDVKFYNSKLKTKYELIKLGDFIDERSEKVKLSDDPEKFFKILKVSNKTGVSLSYEEQGKEFNQSYKKVYKGDIVYNPYRINVGSIGIVPKDCDGMFVSPAYVVFSVDEDRYRGKLLEFILRASWYNPQIRAATAGSVRQNLTVDLLKDLQVPDIPLERQDTIINLIDTEKKYFEKANNLKQKIIKITDLKLYKMLGLDIDISSEKPKVMTVFWDHLERWGTRYNQNRLKGFDISQGIYPLVSIADIVNKTQYGTSKKAHEEELGIPVLRMNNIKKRFIEVDDLKYINISGSQLDSLLLKKGDILIIRTNGSRDLVGTSAVFDKDEQYIFASYLIRIQLDHQKANPYYVSWFINSQLGREQIELMSRQIMQNNINAEEIRSIVIPLPNLKVQNDIVSMIDRQVLRSRSVDMVLEKRKEVFDGNMQSEILGY